MVNLPFQFVTVVDMAPLAFRAEAFKQIGAASLRPASCLRSHSAQLCPSHSLRPTQRALGRRALRHVRRGLCRGWRVRHPGGLGDLVPHLVGRVAGAASRLRLYGLRAPLLATTASAQTFALRFRRWA